jgi:fructokinase
VSGPTRPIAVIGEALIDLVPIAGGVPGQFAARPGGSPYNVAVGLARLDCHPTLLARLADNAFGRLLRRHAIDEGIDLTHAARAVEPTTLAVVSLDEFAQAQYDFYIDGTADWHWTAAELSELPSIAQVVHFGSLASWLPPGASAIADAVSGLRECEQVLVSYDPNVRPSLLHSPERAVPLIEMSVSAAHIVKASRDDVNWLYPDRDVADVAQSWIVLGALLVVITDGAEGARVFSRSGLTLSRPAQSVEVVDTVGAGDAFSAGLLAGLQWQNVQTAADLLDLTSAMLAQIIDSAIRVSALTCQQAGADPPRLRASDFGW